MALSSLLKELSARHEPAAFLMGGYSQGGMMAMDLALLRVVPVDRVVVWSGTLLAASVSGLRATGITKEPVFVTHGHRAQTLSFAAGERLKTLLSEHGHPVMWRPFDGGHRPPPDPIMQEMLVFLGGSGRH
jgi:phospholipase/carboxylesterase